MKKIELQNRKGRIALQLSVNGQRYSLYGLGNWDSHSGKAKAELLVRHIESDILEGSFDPTLEQYKQGINKAVKSLDTPVEMFARWVEYLKVSDKTFRMHYEPVLQALIKNGLTKFSDKGIATY